LFKIIVKNSVLFAAMAAVPASAQYTTAYNTGYPSANPAYGRQAAPVNRAGASSYYSGGQSGAQVPYTYPSGSQNAYGSQAAYGTQQQAPTATNGYGDIKTDASGAPIRYEAYIPPNEMPSRYAAHTTSARPGISGLTRPINFPRDPGDDVDVLKLQVFLDYHGYSVGEIDGQWGYNTERALYVYQKNNAMPTTGQLDDKMMQRINSFADGYLLEYTLTADDVKGPFYEIPRTYPEQEKLKYLAYETLTEELGEKFHCSQSLLRKLNPGVDLDSMQAGQSIYAINVLDGIDDKRGKVAKIQISKANKWIEAFDSENRFMFYFPSTLGSEHDDLKLGSYKVESVIPNPPFTYNPKLMWDAKPGEKLCNIPPGPNSPVGNWWIQTSKQSVGIHGTPNPENISKNFSHGCIRTCNWDTRQLAKRVESGTPIEVVP
jgi:lipoprotein-anchoring transpeptidase ErfK/SrfK